MDIWKYNNWFDSFDNCEYTIALRVNIYLEVQRLIRQLILIIVTVVSLEYFLFPVRFLGSKTLETLIIQGWRDKATLI